GCATWPLPGAERRMATCQDNRRSPATSRRNMGCTGKREGKRWVWRIGPYWSPMRLESTLERGRYSWRCRRAGIHIRCKYSEDLHRLANWLQACGVTTVAMESTG